jgi:hypothetical protein
MQGKEKAQSSAMPYSLIQDKFDNLQRATINKIEREWPEKYLSIDSGREWFLFTFNVARNTYHTITYICADIPNDPDRRREYSLSVPPLNRTILENLIAVIFVMKDISKYATWFHKAGWLEWKEALGRYHTAYEGLPDWKPFIDKISHYVQKGVAELRLTERETANPEQEIGYWPTTPGKILRKLENNHTRSPSVSFVKYLIDWFHKELSGESHLNARGLTSRGMFFSMELMKVQFGDGTEAIMLDQLEKFRNKQVWLAIILMLSLISKIESHFGFGLGANLNFVWKVSNEYSLIARELYDRRYSSLLGSLRS